MRIDRVTFLLAIALMAILIPASAVATVSLLKIQGGAGNVANVDVAHQLLAAESDPKTFLSTPYAHIATASCTVIDTQPASKALIVQQLRFVVEPTSASLLAPVYVYPNTTCSGTPMYWYQPTRDIPYSVSSLDYMTDSFVFEPGVPIAAGGGVSATASLTVDIALNGYTVPPTAVP